MSRRYAYLLIGAMVLGIALGLVLNRTLPPEQAKDVAHYLNLVTDLFLRLIKMIIAPLVFSTLVAGIAHMEGAAAVGRMGLRAVGWFLGASLVSLTIGLVMANLLEPGVGLHLTLPAADAASGIKAAKLTLGDVLTHLVPKSIVEAMANNEILQIVVFSVFVGTAVTSLGGKAPAIVALADQIAQVMLKVTGYVMRLAPLSIFAALASTVATQGPDVLATYARFVGEFYLCLAILWTGLFAAAFAVIGPRARHLSGAIRTAALLSFATASSEASYPRLLEVLPRFGVARKVVSFVLPLGYSFNLDGSMMYCTFAVLFIAQAYGVPLSIGQQIGMLLLLMITSKGIAGVPRASIVVISATLAYVNLPEAGLLLILAVDQLLDMGRSATNVVGNSVAAAVVAKWEGLLGEGEAEEDSLQAAPAAA